MKRMLNEEEKQELLLWIKWMKEIKDQQNFNKVA
jgi:hypothetical protein